MIYSRWRPDGGYDYFETPERQNLGDDLAQPQLPGPAGGIGVPAQECGRVLPSGAQLVGKGDIPNGLIVPAPGGVTGVSGLDSTFGGGTTNLVAFGLGAVLGYYIAPWLKRHV